MRGTRLTLPPVCCRRSAPGPDADCAGHPIASFFMQALFELMLIRVAIAAGVFWLLIVPTLFLTDYITRGWLPVPGK